MRTRTTMQILLMSLALLSISGCQQQSGQTTGGGANRVETQQLVEKRNAVMEESQKKRDTRVQELKAMDVPRLAQELANESQTAIEPFNSLAFAEMLRRGDTAAGPLAALITKPDRSSFFGLLALRKIGPAQYKQLNPELRVGALVDALKNSKYFNTWGMPHLSWNDGAKAIIEEGTAADKPLRELLSDKRDAPSWGYEHYAEYQRYKYRVCDYAWALLNEIHGQKIQIPEDPAARDRLRESSGTPK